MATINTLKEPMKKLLLILMLPTMATCGDNPVVGFVVKAIQGLMEFQREHPILTSSIIHAVGEQIEERQKNEQLRQYCDAHLAWLEAGMRQLEKEEAAAKAKAEDTLLNQQLSTCLNENFHRRDNNHGFPHRCGSPARRYAAVNALATDQLIGKHKTRKAVARSQQFRVYL